MWKNNVPPSCFALLYDLFEQVIGVSFCGLGFEIENQPMPKRRQYDFLYILRRSDGTAVEQGHGFSSQCQRLRPTRTDTVVDIAFCAYGLLFGASKPPLALSSAFLVCGHYDTQDILSCFGVEQHATYNTAEIGDVRMTDAP